MHCSVMERMTSLSFQIEIQKNEAKLSSFAQFENEMASYHCSITEHSTTFYVLTVLEHCQKLNDVMRCSLIIHGLHNGK